MSTPTNLNIQAGVPYTRQVRLVDGKDVWPTLDTFEVRSHVRRHRSSADSDLLFDFTPHLTAAYDGNDIVVGIALTGAQTRTVRGGVYDLLISDVGTTDARAVVLMAGVVVVEPVVTSAS